MHNVLFHNGASRRVTNPFYFLRSVPHHSVLTLSDHGTKKTGLGDDTRGRKNGVPIARRRIENYKVAPLYPSTPTLFIEGAFGVNC